MTCGYIGRWEFALSQQDKPQTGAQGRRRRARRGGACALCLPSRCPPGLYLVPRRSATSATSPCARSPCWRGPTWSTARTPATAARCSPISPSREPTRAYHEHNAERERPRVLAELAAGKSVAVISDAGTPLISDPGYKLVREAIAAGHPVTSLPGPSAALAALAAAGPRHRRLPVRRLPAAAAEARRVRLAELKAVPAHAGLLRGAVAAGRQSRRHRRRARRRARPRSRASSPSCTRRCGAARRPSWRNGRHRRRPRARW